MNGLWNEPVCVCVPVQLVHLTSDATGSSLINYQECFPPIPFRFDIGTKKSVQYEIDY